MYSPLKYRTKKLAAASGDKILGMSEGCPAALNRGTLREYPASRKLVVPYFASRNGIDAIPT
jgi:hypothetical protein